MKRKVSLDTDEIDALIKDIEAYRDSLSAKCVIFLERLADEGITIAERHVGPWTQIAFVRTVIPHRDGAVGMMTGYAPIQIIEWQFYNSIKSAELSPILMAEFGSGQYASDARGRVNQHYAAMVGAGRGTFPGQTHATEDSWRWKDLNGDWHQSSGLRPEMPMYYAARRMRRQIERIGRQVFRT